MSEIRNRYTGEVICSGECSVRELAEKHRANLRSANLCGADLSGAKLHGASLCGADLFGADLCGADLRGASLREANLSGTNLRGANLCVSNLGGANLGGANLGGANLSVANLRGAKYGEETPLKYLSIGPIGSRNDALQVFITKENIYLRTGCWSGSPEELIGRTDREDYRESVDYILTVAKRVRKEV